MAKIFSILQKLISASLLLATITTINTSAQVQFPYTIDFESNNTSPNTQTHQATDTVIANGLKWLMPGTYYGPGNTNDYKVGNQSARIRLTNDATGAPGSMYMVEDIALGMHDFKFKTAMSNGEGDIGKLLVYYSQNQGATWNVLSDTIIVPPYNNPMEVHIHDHIMGNVRIKIAKIDNNNSRINVDEIYYETMNAPPPDTLFFTQKYPEGAIVHPVNTNSLRLVFNQHIKVNVGEFKLHKVGSSTQTFNVQTSPNIEISNDTFIVKNISLLPESTYYITFNADAIVSDYHGASVKTNGITSDTVWRFSTSAIQFNQIDEKFDNCGDDGVLGVFKQYNAYGVFMWECTNADSFDTLATLPYVSIKGSDSSKAYENIDFLITNLPLDLNNEVANFSFKEKRIGTGINVKRSVMYATNFSGNPFSANWKKLDNKDLPEITKENEWQSFNYKMYSAITAQPFYLCFKYESTGNQNNNDAWLWALDDIRLVSSVSNKDILRTSKNLHLTILGAPSRNEANIRVSLAQSATLNIDIYDINGRLVYRDKQQFQIGTQIYTVNNPALQSGLYLVRMYNDNCMANVKMMVP